MSTEVLEKSVENKGDVNNEIFPCIHQRIASNEYFKVKDDDWPGEYVPILTRSPRAGARENCGSCINDSGNFMCPGYQPIKIRTFDVRENIQKISAPDDYVELIDIPRS
jgi:hypothetical protein